MVAALPGCAAAPARAATPASFVAAAVQPLRFGTVVTSGSGTRTVGPDGSTSNSGVLPLGDSTSGPATFTMTYTRASNDQNIYQLLIQVSLPQASGQTVNGVSGTVSGFTTDLPGIPVLRPGQSAVFTLNNCVSATCTVTFHIGGTLAISGGTRTASLTFPLVLLTSVTAVLG